MIVITWWITMVQVKMTVISYITVYLTFVLFILRKLLVANTVWFGMYSSWNFVACAFQYSYAINIPC